VSESHDACCIMHRYSVRASSLTR